MRNWRQPWGATVSDYPNRHLWSIVQPPSPERAGSRDSRLEDSVKVFRVIRWRGNQGFTYAGYVNAVAANELRDTLDRLRAHDPGIVERDVFVVEEGND